MKRGFGLAFALALGMQALAGNASAGDVKRFIAPCGEGKLCPWFLADVAPPTGFVANEKFGSANRIVAFFPDTAKLGPESPLIYIRTSYNDNGRSLDQQASNSNAQWKTMVKDAVVERLPDIPRAQGKGAWQVYRYANPSRPRQAHEVLAFGEHVEKEGQKFFYMVTVSASSEKGVAQAMPGWREVLGKL